MKMIIMQCDCGANVVLAMSLERRKMMGWCLADGRLYDIGCPDVGDDEIAEMMQKAHRVADQAKTPMEALFYLRCTELQMVKSV